MKDYRRIARKITVVLFLCQSLNSAGGIAAFTVNALVAVDLSGLVAMAGVAGAFIVAGVASGAPLWSYCMERMGRRWGIVLGQLVGVMGAVTAAVAITRFSFPLFLVGLILIGMARAAIELGRFAAAEVHPPSERGRAISSVVLGGTVGAIVGPLLVAPTGKVAQWAGYPELVGPYCVTFIGSSLAAALVFVWLRPDPREIGRELALVYPEAAARQESRPLAQIIREPAVIVAMAAMVFSQMVMMVPMSITSVHMKAHAHSLGAVSVVISAHTLGMFAFSKVSGWLTDRWGRYQVIILGSVVNIASCLMAAPSVGLLPLAVALFLLGLGWNFAYVAGSALLADQLSSRERAKTQGFNDLLLNVGSGGSQIVSGIVYAVSGYATMSLVSAGVAALPLTLAIWQRAASCRARTRVL